MTTQTAAASSRRDARAAFARDASAFTGAERALMVCFALAMILSVGYLLGRGGERAGQDAARTLARGTGAVSGIGPVGGVMGEGALMRAAGITTAPQPLPGGQDDAAYDGAWVGAGGQAYPAGTPFSQIPGVQPSNGQAHGTIIYVNGISTTKDAQAGSLQSLADVTGMQVVGIHNSTGGMISDLWQSAQDKFNVGHNPAVDSLSDAVYTEIQAGRPVHLVGHSQGALITSRALYDVRRRLMIEDGLTAAEAERRMGLIRVETFGGAASSYPDGPRYDHYVNLLDPVPMAVGLGAPGSNGGRGAHIHRFVDSHGGGVSLQNPFTWPPSSPVKIDPPDVHGLEDVYLPHRQN